MKRRSLERVLATKNPERLFERLNNLVAAWKRAPTRDESESELEESPPAVGPAQLTPHSKTELPVAPESHTVTSDTNSAHTTTQPRDDASVLIAELVHLLDVILRNIALFTPHPEWLNGQIELLRQALPEDPQTPADLGQLREAEFRLEETLNRQAEIFAARRAAEAELKSLIAHFLDEIAGVTNLSADYQKELEEAADIIEKASDLAEVSPLLQQLLQDTRAMHQEMSRSHRELAAAKAQAEQADARVKALEAQLAALSAQVARDPLTGLLNRRGLEESFAREANRAQRLGSPLCAALLDIDNFKQLNDTLGHQAGDEALVYLARMARTHLRAQDIVGRYGGEEFVLLLPARSSRGSHPAFATRAHPRTLLLRRQPPRDHFQCGRHARFAGRSVGDGACACRRRDVRSQTQRQEPCRHQKTLKLFLVASLTHTKPDGLRSTSEK
jgi:GGDEF domain-containing protein